VINFVIMFVCLIAGAVIRACGGFSVRDVRPLNTLILWVALPAVVLTQVPVLVRAGGAGRELAMVVATPWFNFFCALAVVFAVARVCGWSRAWIGALVLTMGLGTTSFVGVPVVETLFGEPGMRVAILIDQLGSFLILATFGLLVASICAGRDLRVATVVRRIAFFPPFVACVVALLWGVSSLPVEGIAVEALKRIGSMLVPLALLSVGWQLQVRPSVLRRYAWPLCLGLAFKLFVWPAVVVILWGHSGLNFGVNAIEAAMPPMITGAVVAADFELESELAQLMVGLGIPLSVLTLWFWSSFLKFI
jgi:predicted permease